MRNKYTDNNDILLKETLVIGKRVIFNFEPRGSLKSFFNKESLFIEYDRNIETVPISILNIAFVASLLPLIWLTDTIMWVNELDRTFYDCTYRLRTAYQDLYSHYPLKGRLVVANPRNNTYIAERESLLLFSGGIDAHVSYLKNQHLNPVLCNIQGWFKDNISENYLKAVKADYNDILMFALERDLDFEFVKSNFAILVKHSEYHKTIERKLGDSWWHGFQHSMAFISIAIPLAYLYKIKNIYIASSFSLGLPGKCASYATTDIEFKYADIGGCIHDSFDMSRQEKVKYLVNYQKKSNKPYPVRVCSFNDINCCSCEKCFRTILEIIAANGDIKNFGFQIEGSLKEYWEGTLDKILWNFDVKGESLKHWPDSIKAMKDQYSTINDKEFVDWFLQYDFIKARKIAKRKYYKDNFWAILKRKLKI